MHAFFACDCLLCLGCLGWCYKAKIEYAIMARSKSSARWLQEHNDDFYVKKSKELGYRSRASFKLVEMHEQSALIKPGMSVVDLGAAPGGWSQIASRLVGDHGKVIATDLLPISPMAGVDFVQGDFTEQSIYEQMLKKLGGRKVDLVLSDMAPNISGNKVIDQAKAMYLAELALDYADQALAPGGTFVVKVFQGAGVDEYRKEVQARFAKLLTKKPKASRPRSKEVYILGVGFK